MFNQKEYNTKWRAKNREKLRVKNKVWRESESGKLSSLNALYRKRYGIDYNGYNALVKNFGGRCAICSKTEKQNGKKYKPHGLQHKLQANLPKPNRRKIMSTIATIAKAAEKNFDGLVLEVAKKQRKDGEFFVYIRRNNPPLKDRPYMYCTAYMQGESPVFIWGHYDLESCADFINHQ